MGWFFPYHTYNRKTLIDERVAPYIGENHKIEVIRYCVRGNNLWKLTELTMPDGKVERFIALDMMQKSGGTWGYKDLDDGCGPFYYNCPLCYVDACTETTHKTANHWREQVRKYWAERNAA